MKFEGITESKKESFMVGQLYIRTAFCVAGCFAGAYLGRNLFQHYCMNIFSDSLEQTLYLFFPAMGVAGYVYFKEIMGIEKIRHSTLEAPPENKEVKNDRIQRKLAEANRRKEESSFKLVLGKSQGLLFSRGHQCGVEEGKEIVLDQEDTHKNIIVFGGTGSGKTTRTINPFLKQILKKKAGALVLDIKGDYGDTVMAIAQQVDPEKASRIKKVGLNGATLNLLDDTTPELAASFLKSLYLSTGSGSGDSAYFVDSAVEFTRQALHLILLTGEDYSLAGLHSVVNNKKKREALLDGIEQKAVDESETLEIRTLRLIDGVSTYFRTTWEENVHDDGKGSILSTISQVLTPFAHPDLADAFSTPATPGNEVSLSAVFDEDVIIVDFPIPKFGREGARFAYMLLKLRFYNLMRERRSRKEWGQKHPVAFVCDEFQAIADKISDIDFWDKSRSTGCIGLVSMQGVASFIDAVGSKDTMNAILQNFRQKIIFRTEDLQTIEYAQKLLGQIEVTMMSDGDSGSESTSISVSRPNNPLPSNGPGSTTEGYSNSSSWSENYSVQMQNLLDARDIRALDTDYALFIGNVGPRALDEVIKLQPLFVKS